MVRGEGARRNDWLMRPIFSNYKYTVQPSRFNFYQYHSKDVKYFIKYFLCIKEHTVVVRLQDSPQ